MKCHHLLLLPSLFTLLFTACQQTESDVETTDRPAATAPPTAPSVVPASDAPGTAEAAGVVYEPAYPDEVSTEGIDHEDAAQQEAHSHGDDEHSHGDESHSHDEGDPDHDDDDHEN